MIARDRQQAIFYLFLAIIGMFLLAAGLPGLQFQPGLPVPGAETTTNAANPVAGASAQAKGIELQALLQGAAALGIILLSIILVIDLVRKAGVKRSARIAAGLVLLLALFFLLPKIIPSLPTPTIGKADVKPPQEFTYNVAPIGDPPAQLGWIVLTGLLLGAVVLCAWLAWHAFRRLRSEDPLAQEASAALRAIEDGQDLKSVIIRCYLQMTRIVKEERGLEREESVTPREFERFLAAKGIPETPIRQLTRLFEKARYGSKAPDRQDEQDAVECLSAIRLNCHPVEAGGK